MIRPIVAYGSPVLKKKAVAIEPDYHKLSVLIDDMWETMYASNGVGLAAPQIGLSVRLFVIDAAPFAADEELDAEEVKTLESFKKVYKGSSLGPFTSILLKRGKVTLYFSVQKNLISSLVPGSCALNWLQGKAKISKLSSLNLLYKF